MGESATGLLSRTFLVEQGWSWSLIGKIAPGETVHRRMCTLHVRREVRRRRKDPGGGRRMKDGEFSWEGTAAWSDMYESWNQVGDGREQGGVA